MEIKQIPFEHTQIIQITNLLSSAQFKAVINYNTGVFKPKAESRMSYVVDVKNKNTLENPVYHFIFSQIKNVFYSVNINELYPTGMNVMYGKPAVRWHKHRSEFRYDPINIAGPDQLWIAIYYFHPEWDINDTNGQLRVSKNPTDMGMKFQPIPNSCIIHDSSLGHAVDNPHSTNLKRISGYSHWVK